MRFTVSGETGEDAAEYARVVTDVFMAYHKERQSRRIEAEIARTEKRIEAAEDEAEEARQLYNEFREKHGIADLSTEQQSMVESAAELRADSEFAVSEIRAIEAQVASLEAQLASTPKTSFVSGGTSPERATYNQLAAGAGERKSHAFSGHPRVQALEQQVSQLRSQLRSAVVRAPAATASSESTRPIKSWRDSSERRSRAGRSSGTSKGAREMADKAQSEWRRSPASRVRRPRCWRRSK